MPQSQYIQGAFVAVDQKKALWQTLLVLLALALTIAQYFSILPEWLFRVPAAVLPPLERWLDAFFNFVNGVEIRSIKPIVKILSFNR